MSTISDKEPITASFPVCFAKLIAACTFGPIEPAAKPSSEIASGEATEIAFWVGFPQSTKVAETSVAMMNKSASRFSASKAEHKSLSITASTPCKLWFSS